ncbi:MAG: NFACT family protein, partial [Deltaproteobacteria bacterium]|nr:NFACT family protein [Deltaproteobacteria bacterium]
MTLSVAELELVVADLRERLLPAHLERARSPAEQGLLLELRAHGRNHWLLASFEPTAARLHLTDRGAAGDAPAAGFARTVHATLAGRRLLELEALPGERAVRLVFADWQLLLELTGRHANAFLVDAQGVIRSSFRASQSRKRRLLWGEPYQAPLPRADEPWQRAPSRFPGGEAVHATIAAHYAGRAAEAVELGRRRGALQRLRHEVRRLERLVPRLARELDEAGEAEVWRRRGELLKGAPPDTPRGASVVRVRDWFDPAAPEVDLPLDPARGLRENMTRCFTRARKLGRRPETVGPRLATARRELRQALDELELLDSASWDDPAA